MFNRWEEFNAEDLKEVLVKEEPVVVLPIASCEQHGKHLPLETDEVIGRRIIEKAAERAQDRVIILPSVWTGYSPHHMDFCGTITLSPSTFSSLIIDICRSLNEHGAQKILLFNSHGGNRSILKTVVSELGSEENILVVLATYFDLAAGVAKKLRKTDPGGMGHAGELETSLQLVLSPELVQKDRIQGNIIEGNPYHQPGMYTEKLITQYRQFAEYSEVGVIGEPRAARRETGEKLLAAIIDEVTQLLDDMAAGVL